MLRARTFAKILLPVLVIGAAMGGAGYLQATKPSVEPEPVTERVWAVAATPAHFSDHQPVLSLFGELVASRRAVLQAPIEGRVVKVSPKLVDGGSIAEGELLLMLDTFDLEVRRRDLEASVKQHEARLAELNISLSAERDMLALGEDRVNISRRDLDRQKKLLSSSFSSKKNLDEADMRYANEQGAKRQRQREVEAVSARILQQEAEIERLLVSLDQNARDLAEAAVHAPFDALIEDVDVAPGKELRAYDKLAGLIDRQSIEIYFTLDDADFGRLWKAGLIDREVQAEWQLGHQTFALQGRVSRIQSSIDATRGGIGVYAQITQNPGEAPLRPGAFLKIRMKDQPYQNVARLPRSALFEPNTIYGVVEDRLVNFDVEVVDRSADSVLIRAPFDEGLPIVTTRLSDITPGLKVEVTY